MDLPDKPAGLTREWLSAALGADVSDVVVTAVGTGQTGSSYRVVATYAEPCELPTSFVAKLPAEDPEVRQRVSLGYRAEVSFYANVATSLRVPVPRCFYSDANEDASSFVLLLEDLAPAVQGDQLAGCSVDDARAGAIALAGLHGPRWCDPAWLELTDTVMPKPDADGARGLGDVARMATDLFLAALAPRMTAEDAATLDAYPALVAPWLLAEPDRFGLLHGDFRLDNLMFGPGSITVVDWQTISVGLPARDLAFFLSTSLSPADRRSSEMSLVAAYHSALLGYGVRDYDLTTCEQDYRLGMLHTPLIATLGWAFSTATARGDLMMLTMLERSCAAIRDLGTLELLRELA